MPSFLPIGLGAGAVAAVLFASASTGPLPARVLLFFLAPLPTFLAGLGWGWMSALAATFVSATAVGVLTGAKAALVYALSQGLPVVLLCYLAYLNRPITVAADGAPQVEWYPIGRLVALTAAIAGALAMLTLLMMGGDLDALRKGLRAFLENVVLKELPPIGGGKAMDEENLSRLTEIALYMLPAASAMSWLAGLLGNFWLAGRITLASGRLLRPWPDLAAMQFPRAAPIVLAGATALTFLGGMPALAGAGFAGALLMAYVLMGLAVLHYVTRGSPWRPFMLAVLYAALILINSWVALLVAIIGLAEPFSPLKRNLPPA